MKEREEELKEVTEKLKNLGFETGKRYSIIGSRGGHLHEIGDEVEIIGIETDESIHTRNVKTEETWWVYYDELAAPTHSA